MPLKKCLAWAGLAALLMFCPPVCEAGSGYAPGKRPMTVGLLRESPPLAFGNKNEKVREVRGLAVDLALMLNYSIGRETVFRLGGPEELRRWLRNGDIDYISGLPQFLGPEYNTGQTVVTGFAFNRRILVLDPDMHITCEQDYSGHTLALLESDANYSLAAASAGAVVRLARDYREGFALLTSGRVDAFVAPCGEIATYLAQLERVGPVKLLGLSLERIPLLLVTPEWNSELRSLLAGTLERFESRGELDILREKWLGREIFSPPGFWDRYGRIFLYGGAGLVLIMLSVVGWSIALRKRVRHVTRHLEQSQQRYRQLIEASPDLIMIVDKNGRLRLANRISRETLFCVDESYENYSLMQALCETGQSTLHEMLQRVLSGGMVRREIVLHPDSNSPKTLEVIAFHTEGMDSGEPMACCIARDITERQRMEQQLLQVEKLAVIGKLAAGVAHEINNPLGIILTNAEMALEMEAAPDVRTRLEAIQRNVARAASITQRLLHLAVPARMKPARLNLSRLVGESLNFLAPRLKNVRVDLRGLDPRLDVEGDQALLQQLLINLLFNALDSMGDAGSLQISGFVQERGEEGGVCLLVRDSGPGIERERLERVFDLFYTTRNKQGFGLGLFISRQIAEQHGGVLYAESEAGRGATFVLELPLRKHGAAA